METIVKIWELFSPSAWKKILLGHNVKKEWYPIAAEDSKIVLRKCGNVSSRASEFVFRIAISYFLCALIILYITNRYFTAFLSDNLCLRKLIFIAGLCIPFFIICLVYYSTFISGTVGINVHDYKKNLKWPCMLFLPNIVLVFLSLYFYNSIKKFIFSAFIYFIILFMCCILLKYMFKIEDFKSGSPYYDHEDSKVVRIDKDIFLEFADGTDSLANQEPQLLNLLTNNFYICDNNDILIIPKDGDPVIYKPNELGAIKIKNTRIIYDDSDKEWKKLTTSS